MKKILVLSLLLAGISFGEEGVAAQGQKMKQAQENSGIGAMNVERERNKEKQEEKKREQYENKYKKGEEQSQESKMKNRDKRENRGNSGGSSRGGAQKR